jgi:hypothetical protein
MFYQQFHDPGLAIEICSEANSKSTNPKAQREHSPGLIPGILLIFFFHFVPPVHSPDYFAWVSVELVHLEHNQNTPAYHLSGPTQLHRALFGTARSVGHRLK